MITKKIKSVFSKLNFFHQVYSYFGRREKKGYYELEEIENQVEPNSLNLHIF